jgi:hypothetical protein
LSKIKRSLDQPQSEVLEWFRGVLARQVAQKLGDVSVASAELQAKSDVAPTVLPRCESPCCRVELTLISSRSARPHRGRRNGA